MHSQLFLEQAKISMKTAVKSPGAPVTSTGFAAEALVTMICKSLTGIPPPFRSTKENQLHFVNPQSLQTAHPPSCSTAPPQSGQAPQNSTFCCFGLDPLPLLPAWAYFSIALEIASEQEDIFPPLTHAGL
jgi:hypothetical protein